MAEIKKFRFKKKVTAGDRIDLEAEILEKIGNIATLSVKASVMNELVGKGELTVALK